MLETYKPETTTRVTSDKWWKSSYIPSSPWPTRGYSIREVNEEGEEKKTEPERKDYYYGTGRTIFDYDYSKRYRSSIGWDRGRLSSLSSYSWSSYRSSTTLSESEKILSCAYKSVRDMIVILNFPFEVVVKVTNSHLSEFHRCSGSVKSVRISVPTEVLDSIKYNNQEKIDIFCGLGLHEASHLKFTNLSVLDRFSTGLSGDKLLPVRLDFIKSLINLIEDERVEDRLLNERPGYSDFIEKAKKYNYSLFIEADKGIKDLKVGRYLNNLFKIIRWPSNIDESALEEFSDSYQRVKDIIFPLPESTKDSIVKGVKIFEEIIRYFKEIKVDDKTLPESEINKFLSKAKIAIDASINTVLYGFDCDHSYKMNDTKIARDVKSAGKLFERLFSGDVEKGVGKSVYISSEKGNRDVYNRIVSSVRKYIPGIRKVIKGSDKNFEFNIYGCRSGLLDTNKLAEAYQGIPQVYVRKGYVRTNKTTVCVLIDESGSMSCSGKERLARDAAVLLNEALGDLNGVDLYIYGHTADLEDYGGYGTTTLFKYREGSGGNYNKYSLTESHARYENRDGTAIWEAAKRVRTFTQNSCIMIILSDGSPAAHHYYGRSAEEDVCMKVKEVEKMGFTVIQVCIDTVPGASRMFTNVVDLKNDLARLPKELSKLVKNLIVKDKKTEIS